MSEESPEELIRPLSPYYDTAFMAAGLTPSARRIADLLKELHAWFESKGFNCDVSLAALTYLNGEAVGSMTAMRGGDGATFLLDIHGGHLYMRGDGE